MKVIMVDLGSSGTRLYKLILSRLAKLEPGSIVVLSNSERALRNGSGVKLKWFAS